MLESLMELDVWGSDRRLNPVMFLIITQNTLLRQTLRRFVVKYFIGTIFPYSQDCVTVE